MVDRNELAYTGRIIASEKVAGDTQMATAAQVAAGTRGDRAISPLRLASGLTAKLTAPGPIGSTTPSTGSFTSLASSGNLTFSTAGNKIIAPAASNTATAGANSFGTVTLIAGTITVATTAVTANSIILLTRQSVGASTALGILTVGTKTAGVSFVINAATQGTPGTPLAADVSVIGWEIIN